VIRAEGGHGARDPGRDQPETSALNLIGVYDFQRMNQVIIAYHAVCQGEVRLSPELADYRCTRPRRSSAGRPAPAMRWPTGCARAGTSRASVPWNLRRAWNPPPTRIDHMQIDKELDTRGLNCPLPILKAKKALADMDSGQLLRVVSTDGGSVRDFQAFAKQTGNELVEQTTVGAEFIHVLRRR
jgi:tRNA 2-thiouridine synthesizing protein A